MIEDVFEKITRYDIRKLFNLFVDFVANDYSNLINYYSKGSSLDKSTITNLEGLGREIQKVSELFDNYREQLSETSEIWDLLSKFENIKVKYETIQNTSKWFRSSIKRGDYNGNVNIDYTQKQGETIEDIADKVGYNNSSSNWADIAINNGINEEDYTTEGGKQMSVVLQNNSSIYINSVVDNLVGKNIYGKDLSREFSFSEGDIKTLNPDETISQCFEVLISVDRGSIPQFPLDGLDKSLFIGRNLNSIAYPSIFRQLMQVFRKDDSFQELSILNVGQEGDSMFIELQAKTKLGEVINNNIVI